MKNHLSMLGSMGARGRFSLGGMGGSWSGVMRVGEVLTVRLVLEGVSLCKEASCVRNIH